MSSFPRMVPLRWSSPHCLWPHVPRRRLPATTPPVLFRSAPETSTLPSRHLSGGETDAGTAWNGMGNSRKLGDFWPNRRIPWILFGVFFFQHNADHTTDIPAGGSCGSYESWLVFFFFPFFVLLLVFKAGFPQTRNSQCQTANPKKTHLS